MDDDTPKTTPKATPVEIRLDNATAAGQYVNMARIFHTQTEFVLDGIFILPQARQAHVASRLIMSPQHARMLHAALGQNLERYERTHGPITPIKSKSSGGNLH